MRQDNKIFLIIVALIVSTMSACSAPRAIEDYSQQSLMNTLEVRDQIKVVVSSGEEYTFYIREIDEGGITGLNRKVFYEEIRSIQILEYSEARTTGVAATSADDLWRMFVIAFSGAVAFIP